MTMANLLSPAPLQDDPFEWNEETKKWQWTPNWEKWISNINTVVSQYAVSGRSTVAATLYNAISLLQVPSHSTTQINSIVNPDDGLIVYDKTTNQFKGRKAGVWTVII